MRFTTATLITLSLLAGNVVSAPNSQTNDIAVPAEARAVDFEANDAAQLEARAKKNKKKAKKAKAVVRAVDDDASAVEIREEG
ncbi:hypothetical protein LZ30DRAFT_819224 [Colletotrichum cereale]|nr:hypothetical protein LZ30DRAFT_819224 [Colletotrichum cereale]